MHEQQGSLHVDRLEEQKNVPVTFIGPRWVAHFGEFYFGGRTLAQLIETVQHTFPKDVLVFSIDRKSVEGNAGAEREVLEAADANGALVVML